MEDIDLENVFHYVFGSVSYGLPSYVALQILLNEISRESNRQKIRKVKTPMTLSTLAGKITKIDIFFSIQSFVKHEIRLQKNFSHTV